MSQLSNDEKEAIEVGMAVLFDFMCCKVEQDHGELGTEFQRGANLAFTKVRLRSGDLEGAML